MTNDSYFWCWWGATVAISAWKLIEGLWRPRLMLEWPFLASAMWAYFYGYMAYNAKLGLSEYLGNGIANIGQLMPLLCLIGLILGWNLGKGSRRPQLLAKRTYSYFVFWMAGLFFLVIGAAGGFIVMRGMQNGSLNLQDSSAYWYLLFYVGYPGLALTLWALIRMERIVGYYTIWAVTILVLIVFLFPHVINARRGPLFPAIILLLLVPPLVTRRAPNPLIFCGSLAVAGAIMLLFLQARTVLYHGGTWGQAINQLDVSTVVSEKAEVVEDNEYVNNCQLIGTIYQNGKYQYGTGHLSLLWHWFPHALWKNKPQLGEGYYSFSELFDDVEAATGFHLLGVGAAAAGVADSFVQYGIFCPLYWFGLSWSMGAVYLRAQDPNRPRWLFCYVGFICATHWLVSQGLAAAFVPGMCFQTVPIVVFLLLDQAPSQRRSFAKNRKRSRPVHSPMPNRAIQP